MDQEKVASFLEEMIDVLTIRRVALLAVFASITILALTLFENRTAIFAKIYKSTAQPSNIVWTLSTESKNKIAEFLSNNEVVGIFIVTDVDLKKNRRITKYIVAKDPSVDEVIKYRLSKSLATPLFDSDPKNTDQMLSVLNNEFRCVPVVDTINAKLFPQYVEKYPVICRIAVPPFFGELTGYVSILLTKTLSQEEIETYKIEMNRFAIDLYLRDISKIAEGGSTK